MFNEKFGETKEQIYTAVREVNHALLDKLVADCVEWVKYSIESTTEGMMNPTEVATRLAEEARICIADVESGDAPQNKLAQYQANLKGFTALAKIVSQFD